MKKLIYHAVSGALVLSAALANTSCTEGNDWDVDNSCDRLFSVPSSSLSVTPDATSAEVRWKSTPGSEFYVIEVSKDSLYDGVALGETPTSVVFGEDKSIVNSPYTLEELDNLTQYFIRIKAMSSLKSESKWTYLEKYSFKTKSEQIMEAVKGGDLLSNSVTLHWKAGSKVTRLDIVRDEEVIKNIWLDDNAIDLGTITIDGLEAATTYSAYLYNGEVRRGSAKFKTQIEMPAADKVVIMEQGDSLCQSLFDAFSIAGYESVTLGIPGDQHLSNTGTITIPAGMSVNFVALAADEPVVISVKQFDFTGAHAQITFTGITFDAKGVAADGTGFTADYFVNQSNEAQVTNFTFENCVFKNFAKSFFRMQSSAVKDIMTLSINNCTFDNISNGYAFLHSKEAEAYIHNVVISNCTFSNMDKGKGFINFESSKMDEVNITNCTFYNISSGSNYFIDYKNGGLSGTLSISNSILAKTGGEGVKGIRYGSAAVNVSEVYATSDWFQASNAIKEYTTLELSSDQLFVAPKDGDFHIIPGCGFAGANVAGDPRWFEVEE